MDCSSKKFLLTPLAGHPSAAWSMSQHVLPKVHGLFPKSHFQTTLKSLVVKIAGGDHHSFFFFLMKSNNL